MKTPSITIVVPVYKVPIDLLYKCLDSIVAQTETDFEALLIDDGSPDRDGDICDEYASNNSNFRVIHQENSGLSVVRNNGIKNAKGTWICFVDGDDWIEPRMIEFALRYIKHCGDGDVLLWDEFYDVGNRIKKNLFIEGCDDGKLHYFDNRNKQQLIDMFFPLVYHKFKGNFVDVGTANARLYRKDFLIKNNLYNVPGLKRMQDNVFNLWVFDKADRIYYCCKRLYHYSYNEDAVTQKYSPQNVETMDFLYENMKDFVVKNHDDPEYYQRLYCRFVRIFGELFKLNYANPQNPNRLYKRITMARNDFSNDNFREVIDNFDSTIQEGKLKFIHFMLKHKMFLMLIIYYTLSIQTRKLRIQFRND